MEWHAFRLVGLVERTGTYGVSDTIPPGCEDVTETVPIVRERFKVEKREVEHTAATIRLRTEEDEILVRETLRRTQADIERLPVDRIVDVCPTMREEGDVTIIPIVEEVLVRRFRIVEELHVRRRSDTVEVEETVTLRRQVAHIQPADTETRVSDPGGADEKDPT